MGVPSGLTWQGDTGDARCAHDYVQAVGREHSTKRWPFTIRGDVKPPSLASASPTCSIPPSQPRPLSWGSPATFSAAAVAETAGISAAVVAAGGGPGSGLTEENLRSWERTRSPPASNGSNSNLIRNTLTRPDWDLTAAGSRQL